jgi:hypothetical protein
MHPATFHVTLKALHFVERLRVTDVGDAEHFGFYRDFEATASQRTGRLTP